MNRPAAAALLIVTGILLSAGLFAACSGGGALSSDGVPNAGPRAGAFTGSLSVRIDLSSLSARGQDLLHAINTEVLAQYYGPSIDYVVLSILDKQTRRDVHEETTVFADSIAARDASEAVSGRVQVVSIQGVVPGNWAFVGEAFDDQGNLVGRFETDVNVQAGLVSHVDASFADNLNPPTQLAFGVQPSDVLAGSAIAPPVTVRLLDAEGALVTGATNPVTISLAVNPGGATLGGTLTVNAVNGVATFPDLSLDQDGNGYRLAASSPPLASATSDPFDVLLLPGSRRVFIVNRNSQDLTALDANTYAMVAGPVDLSPGQPTSVALDTTNGQLFITLDGTNALAVLDATSLAPKPGSPIALGGSLPEDVAYDEENDRVYVTTLFGFQLFAFDAASLAPVSGSPVAANRPAEVVYDPNHNQIYVTDNNGGAPDNNLQAYNLALVEFAAPSTSGGFPDGLAFNPELNHVYVTNDTSNSITVFSAGTGTVTALGPPIATGGTGPNGAAYDEVNNRLYVVNRGSNNLSVFDASGFPPAPLAGSPFPTGSQPYSVTYDADLDRVLVVNSGSDNLTVFDAATMTQIPGSPFPTGGTSPRMLTVEQSGG
ncbi:MAG: YncE family protein [Armatimonadetes bacterium]|nr:YncE family protein [Armatimonadota bacterium]